MYRVNQKRCRCLALVSRIEVLIDKAEGVQAINLVNGLRMLSRNSLLYRVHMHMTKKSCEFTLASLLKTQPLMPGSASSHTGSTTLIPIAFSKPFSLRKITVRCACAIQCLSQLIADVPKGTQAKRRGDSDQLQEGILHPSRPCCDRQMASARRLHPSPREGTCVLPQSEQLLQAWRRGVGASRMRVRPPWT